MSVHESSEINVKLGRRWASSLHRFHVFSFAPALFVFTDVCTDAGHKNKVTQWMSWKEPLGVLGNLLQGADWQETRRVPETMTKRWVAPLTRLQLMFPVGSWIGTWTELTSCVRRHDGSVTASSSSPAVVMSLTSYWDWSWSVSRRVFKCQVGVTHLGSADSCCRSSAAYTMLWTVWGGDGTNHHRQTGSLPPAARTSFLFSSL